LKILTVADVSIEHIIGGAERVLYEQSRRLVQKGHAVHILTRKLANHAEFRKIIQGVCESRYECNQKNSLSFLRTTWLNSKQLFESIHETYQFDCIVFYQPFSAFGVIQSPACKKIRKIYTCLSLSYEEFISRNLRPDGIIAKALYYLNTHARKWIEKKTLNASDRIVVLSQYTKDTLWQTHKISPHNIEIIPGGIDLERFRPASNKSEIRQKYNIPEDKVILFSVRNLVPRMGLENLIRAFNILIKKAVDIYLVLGGKGPLKDELIALREKLGLEDYIRFADFIPEKQLPSFYQMADIFILPTKELEGFGLVTLEAMASGLPVLGTPVGGTKEILGKFNPHFLFDDTNPESIASLILEKYDIIKKNPQSWKQIANQCRGFVENNYSWEQNVDSLESLLFE
jgi:glycosyltransferase involved in cell wall biosynthesis